VSTIHRLGNSYDDRNLFLQALLGAVSFALQGRELLGPETIEAEAQPEPGRDQDTEILLDTLLGVVAVAERVMEYVSTSANDRRHRPSAPRRAQRPQSLRALLR
jgi:hypothetical protein